MTKKIKTFLGVDGTIVGKVGHIITVDIDTPMKVLHTGEVFTQITIDTSEEPLDDVFPNFRPVLKNPPPGSPGDWLFIPADLRPLSDFR